MPKSNRTYPHVQDIKDIPTQQSIKKNWDETHNQKESISSLQEASANFENSVSSLQAAVSDLQKKMTNALMPSSSTVAVSAAGGGNQPITQIIGDGTTGTGGGVQTLTLSPSGVTAGTYGDATHVPQVTVNDKGLVTAATTISINAGGDVIGPVGATSNNFSSFDGTTGKLIKDSGVSAASFDVAGAAAAALAAAEAYADALNAANHGSEWSLLTNGDPVTPELVFDSNGDVIMIEIVR